MQMIELIEKWQSISLMLFTHKYWNELCAFLTKQSEVVSVDQYLNTPSDKTRVILKHDVEYDIDLAVNLRPVDVCEALKKKNIKYFESGIEHGTITAIINEYKFEITTLREDVITDGRHAKIKFSKIWLNFNNYFINDNIKWIFILIW